jgi:hypothetical protein
VSGDHDLIVGPFRESIVRELMLDIIAEIEAFQAGPPVSPREAMAALSRVSGMMAGGHFSQRMHDGVFARFFDEMAAWSKTISK